MFLVLEAHLVVLVKFGLLHQVGCNWPRYLSRVNHYNLYIEIKDE